MGKPEENFQSSERIRCRKRETRESSIFKSPEIREAPHRGLSVIVEPGVEDREICPPAKLRCGFIFAVEMWLRPFHPEAPLLSSMHTTDSYLRR